MNSKLFQANILPSVIKAIAPNPKEYCEETSRQLIYSMQAESQILAELDYKILCVETYGPRKSLAGKKTDDLTALVDTTSFIIMTKRGETTDQDIDTLIYCNGRVFNPGHWMNEILLVLSQRLIDVKSKQALIEYDNVATQLGMPIGIDISVMPESVVESLNKLDIDSDSISRLQYIDETLEITL